MGARRSPVDRPLRIQIARTMVAVLAMALLLVGVAYSRVGRGAAGTELARLSYGMANRVASEVESSLTEAGQPTPHTRDLLSRAATDLDASLVLFLEADTPIFVAHGPSLNRALAGFAASDPRGVRTDSGQTPWVPTFEDGADPDRFPPRAGRPVRVQRAFPYAIELPVGRNMTLRSIPLALLPTDDGGFRENLAIVFLVMSLVSLIAAIRTARPVELAAVALERLAASGQGHVEPDGVRELGTVARAAGRLAERGKDTQGQASALVRALGRVMVEPVERLRATLSEIARPTLPAGTGVAWESVDEDVRQLHRAVTAASRWNALETGTQEASIEEHDLRVLLHEVVERFVARRAPDLIVNVEVPAEIETAVRVDARLLASAIVSLLENAREHGGTPVTVRVRRAHTKIEVVVHDGGPGAPYDRLATLFEPFRGGDGTRGDGGLGLGLRNARLILALHGGGLTARNDPKAGGFEVAFWLPAPPVRISPVDRSLQESADWVHHTGERDAVRRPAPALVAPVATPVAPPVVAPVATPVAPPPSPVAAQAPVAAEAPANAAPTPPERIRPPKPAPRPPEDFEPF